MSMSQKLNTNLLIIICTFAEKRDIMDLTIGKGIYDGVYP